MKVRSRWTAGVLAAVVVLGLGTVVSTTAHADTTPPWEVGNTDALGTLTLYDASGNVVTGGNLTDAPFVAYAEASTASPIKGTLNKATLYAATPKNGVPLANWATASLTNSTTYPNAAAPAPLNTATNPVATGSVSGTTLLAYTQSYPNTETTAGYVDVYQLRLIATAAPGGLTTQPDYWTADVLVDPTAGTWSQIYPVPSGPVTTSTSLSVTPNGGAGQGTTETLKATVSPSAAAGSVQFFDGTTSLGTQAVSGGTAQITTTLAVGPHSLTAAFTPTDSTSYAGSTSTAVSYPVTVGTAPTLTSGPSVSGTVRVGSTVSCSAAFSGATSVTYGWTNNGATVAGATSSTLALSAGYANRTVACTAVGTNTYGSTPLATSPGRKVALGAALRATKAPVLGGTFAVGKKVTVSKGTWSPAATAYTYQWKRNGRAIAHATSSSYKLASADKGRTITCTVTAKRTGYANGTATTRGKAVAK